MEQQPLASRQPSKPLSPLSPHPARPLLRETGTVAGGGNCFVGSSGCEVVGGERQVVVLEAVCAETGKRASENKDACVVQDFGGQRCVRCAARGRNVV